MNGTAVNGTAVNGTAASRRLRASLVEAMGGDPVLLDTSGTTAVADVSRRGTRRVAGYQLGHHTMLFVDPDLFSRVVALDCSTATSDSEFRQWADGVGGLVLGQAVMKTAKGSGLTLRAGAHRSRRLDWSDSGDLALMQTFVDAAEPADLDDAEVAMDELDDLAVAVFMPDGVIGAYAGSRPFEEDARFGDIGVVTATHARRHGLGAAAVAALIAEILGPAGIEPLYRCDPSNAGSDRLSASLGFEPALSLTVVELPGS